MRVLFPTKENLSYMSKVANSLSDADYLTVLNITDETINSVEMLKNDKGLSSETLIENFKDNKINAIVVPQVESLPVEDLKNEGISVYIEENVKNVLSSYSGFVQNRLTAL